jgi:FkbM family methyltransferase
MSSVRGRLIVASRRLGVEDRLRDLHGLRSRVARRDRRDMRNLRLLLELTLAEDAGCVDVGANVGAVLRDLVRVAPRGHHIAFEPLPEHAAELARRFPQVDVREAAVSDHVGEATFHRHRARDTRSSLSALDHAAGEIEPFTVRLEDLDSALPAGFAPDLIKIDVEGAEEQVLRGAARTLAEHQPVVVLEHDVRAQHFGTTSAAIHGLLAQAGLRVFDIDGHGPYGVDAFAAQVRSGTIWTFVAHR